MATAPARARHKAGAGAFYIGMSLIGASAVLNMAYDQLSWVGPEVMPRFLTHLYETSGKDGVTLIFVALGLSIILFGFALPTSTGEEPAETDKRTDRTPVPLYSPTDDEGASPPSTTPNGRVILRTQQYVRRRAGPTS